MPAVRLIHIRKNFRRTLRVSDLDQLGVPHEGKPLSWDASNGFTIVTSREMSDSLVAKLPKEFIALPVPGEDEIRIDDDDVDDSAQGNLFKLPSDSLIDPADDDESSTGQSNPVD